MVHNVVVAERTEWSQKGTKPGGVHQARHGRANRHWAAKIGTRTVISAVHML